MFSFDKHFYFLCKKGYGWMQDKVWSSPKRPEVHLHNVSWLLSLSFSRKPTDCSSSGSYCWKRQGCTRLRLLYRGICYKQCSADDCQDTQGMVNYVFITILKQQRNVFENIQANWFFIHTWNVCHEYPLVRICQLSTLLS